MFVLKLNEHIIGCVGSGLVPIFKKKVSCLNIFMG